MTLLGTITVKLSDDPRYTAGQTYDIVLETLSTPDPARLAAGSMDAPPADAAAEPDPNAPQAG